MLNFFTLKNHSVESHAELNAERVFFILINHSVASHSAFFLLLKITAWQAILRFFSVPKIRARQAMLRYFYS